MGGGGGRGREGGGGRGRGANTTDNDDVRTRGGDLAETYLKHFESSCFYIIILLIGKQGYVEKQCFY